MARPVEELERLGKEVAESLEHFTAERELAVERARRAFLSDSVARRERPFNLRWAVGVALSLGLLLGGMMLARDSSQLTFTVDSHAGALDTWLSAGPKPLNLGFSDGTRIDFDPRSRGRVTELGRAGARVALESGSLAARVVHTGQSAWWLVAGPLTVHVTGTRFDMHWNPVREEFWIRVSEGSVRVSGLVVGSERAVLAGERLFVSVAERRLELTSTRETTVAQAAAPARTTPADSPADDGSAAGHGPRATGSSVAQTTSAQSNPLPPKSTWRELLSRGELREAFADAEGSGFAEACESARAGELLGLGDAARLANRPDRVSEALLSLRRRFPKDARSAAAAFSLGKVAFDQRRAYAEAATWFTTCLREQPHGGLAREAAGRLIEAQRAAGNRGAAEQAAREYVARYADGPHAELARSLLR